MKQNWKTLNIALMLVFLGTVFFNRQLLASHVSTIKADEIIALRVTNEMPHNVKIIAWTYDGEIYLLDGDLSLIRKIRIPEVSISNVIQVSGSLFALATRCTKTGEIESVLIQYDIVQGREKKCWTNSKYYIWSISANNKVAVAMSAEGNLLLLGANDFEEAIKYPRRSHYIFVNGAEPIICTAPNLTKLNWRAAFCYREGEFNWRKDGGWRNIAPPFLCDNYLVEKNVKGDLLSISVSDISTGRQLAEYMSIDISALSCIGTDIIYASKSSITIRNLPNLKKVYTLNTSSKKINSVAKINNAIFFVDDMRRIHKHNFQWRKE